MALSSEGGGAGIESYRIPEEENESMDGAIPERTKTADIKMK
jgi:hypothetical protein